MNLKLTRLFLSTFLIGTTATANAQSADAFLACKKYTDRVERVICLEEALEEATTPSADQAVVEEQENTVSVEDFGRSETARDTADGTPSGSAAEKSGFRLPVIGNIFRRDRDDEQEPAAGESVERQNNDDRMESFGRGKPSRVVENEAGEEELFATVTELLLAKPNMWLLKLDNDQVWRQIHPRRYKLREGDDIRIYPTRWGENFRLETSRLNGYIQVVRVE